jgi:hypothetical protein
MYLLCLKAYHLLCLLMLFTFTLDWIFFSIGRLNNTKLSNSMRNEKNEGGKLNNVPMFIKSVMYLNLIYVYLIRKTKNGNVDDFHFSLHSLQEGKTNSICQSSKTTQILPSSERFFLLHKQTLFWWCQVKTNIYLSNQRLLIKNSKNSISHFFPAGYCTVEIEMFVHFNDNL